MKDFLHADFLLDSDIAAALYHEVAAPLPCIDYHCHLSPEQVAADHRFRSITELWLDGDHYKWRALRAAGVPEDLITGPASDWVKFEAWAGTVPDTVGNPLYHWTHMELRRPFGITRLLDAGSARHVFVRCNERLAESGFTARGLLQQFQCLVVCSTDDPADTLEAHRAHAEAGSPGVRLLPTWRPDRALAVHDATGFNAWLDRLAAASGVGITTYADFWTALERRHEAFHGLGCRASDHGLETIDAEPWSDARLAAVFDTARAGGSVSAGDARIWRSGLLQRFAEMDHARGWVQQYHLGALRNNNSRLHARLGADSGCDSIGDFDQARPLSRFLDALDRGDRLARTILYNLNPRDNELFATMIGNFQDGTVPGKLQYGAAWWFLDQKDGIEAQFRTLANLGLFTRFVGMVTDSRSFLSYSRHEYFRRLLCNFLGEQVTRGLLPNDRPLLDRVVRGICYENARQYFRLEAETPAS
jgi:glucuronate isomerase